MLGKGAALLLDLEFYLVEEGMHGLLVPTQEQQAVVLLLFKGRH